MLVGADTRFRKIGVEGSKVDHSLSDPGEPELWRLEIGDCERAARHLAGVFVTRSGRATGKTWIAEGGDSMDRERAEEFHILRVTIYKVGAEKRSKGP
ncbi:hypothetical protein EYC84_001807 [Monilinia fructicola]|uniref:Uncharacterized protein n=1 Tax=Monilinia fructicola TaxID=38448 RepID=A0A5M9JYQ3_MONFR|nr:hypothetical protein EYC84_001807 [Monilinia fructicola]